MEVELKYVVPDYETFEQLLSLTHLGDFWLRPAADQRLTDHYYDTAGRAVLRGGYALRLRENAERGQWVGTLKGLADASGKAAGAEHEREEFETSVPPGAAPADWPAGAAHDRALALSGEQPLQEIVAIAQERHKRIVIAGDGAGGDEPASGRAAAELSLDIVSLPHNGRERVIYELEIELLPGGAHEDLALLVEALSGYQLAPQRKSKFERALAVVDGLSDEQSPSEPPEDQSPAQKTPRPKAARPKTPGVRADEPMAAAGRKVLGFHFDRMVDQEAGVRLGVDIEAVHDMRVAARRQRAALALFAAHFKRKPVRRLNDRLKVLAHLLGAVRDLDVQLKAAQAYHDQLSGPAAEALQPVLEAWTRERETARAALLAHLESADYRDFKKAYKKFLHVKSDGAAVAAGGPTPNLVRQVLPGQLWDHYGEVRAYESVIAGAGVPTLHALRIASKSLRYALEFFREVLEPAAGGKSGGIGFAIESVVALQDHIGDLHDADVTIARLRAFLAAREKGQPRHTRATVSAVRQYMKAKQAELDHLHHSAARPWSVVSGTKFRKILGKASAGL